MIKSYGGKHRNGGKYHHQSKQSSQHRQHEQQHTNMLQHQQAQTNSDHSLEKSAHTHTHTQTHSNTKFSDQYQSYSPITPIIDYSNNNSDIFSDYSLEAMNSASVAVGNNPTNGTTNQQNKNSNPLDTSVTYKSIMIIDVLNKQHNQNSQLLGAKLVQLLPNGITQQPNLPPLPSLQPVATSTMPQIMLKRCRDELQLELVNNNGESMENEDDNNQNEEDDTSIYINEIKFYNDQNLQNDVNHYISSYNNNTNHQQVYEQQPVLVTSSAYCTNRKVRNGIERNINNFYVLKNKSNAHEDDNKDVSSKNKMLKLNNYVLCDEKKIASYDITSGGVKLVKNNCIQFVTPTVANGLTNSIDNDEEDDDYNESLEGGGGGQLGNHHHHHLNYLNSSKKVRVKI